MTCSFRYLRRYKLCDTTTPIPTAIGLTSIAYQHLDSSNLSQVTYLAASVTRTLRSCLLRVQRFITFDNTNSSSYVSFVCRPLRNKKENSITTTLFL